MAQCLRPTPKFLNTSEDNVLLLIPWLSRSNRTVLRNLFGIIFKFIRSSEERSEGPLDKDERVDLDSFFYMALVQIDKLFKSTGTTKLRLDLIETKYKMDQLAEMSLASQEHHERTPHEKEYEVRSVTDGGLHCFNTAEKSLDCLKNMNHADRGFKGNIALSKAIRKLIEGGKLKLFAAFDLKSAEVDSRLYHRT